MQSDNNTATPIVTAVGVLLQLESFTVSENDVVSSTGTKSITFSKAFNFKKCCKCHEDKSAGKSF